MSKLSERSGGRRRAAIMLAVLGAAGVALMFSLGTPDVGCGGPMPEGIGAATSALTSDAGDRDNDGVPDDIDKCDTPAEYVPGYGNRRYEVGPDGCKRVVVPRICVGDTNAPSMVRKVEGGYWSWPLVVRPVQMARGASRSWAVSVSLYEYVADNCEVLVGSLTGSLTWSNAGKRVSVPFACNLSFAPAVIEFPVPADSPSIKHLAVGRPMVDMARFPNALSAAPCIIAIPPSQQEAFGQSLPKAVATIQSRVDVWDANRNHLAMGFGPATLAKSPMSLTKPGFEQQAVRSVLAQPAPHACVAGQFPPNLQARVQVPVVATASTLDNAEIVVSVAGANVRDRSGAGAVCATQPPRVAYLADLKIVRGAARESLVHPQNPVPCAIDPATGNVTCSVRREHLAAEPGMSATAKVALYTDLGTELSTMEVSTP